MKKPGPQGRTPKGGTLRWFVFGLFSVFALYFHGRRHSGLCIYVQIDQSLPSVEALKNYHPPLVTAYIPPMAKLIGEFFVERRYLVPLNELPPHLVKAFIAAEDTRFYEHSGVDIVGIFRAVLKNLKPVKSYRAEAR